MASQKYSIIVDTNMLGYYKRDNLICSNFNYLAVCKEMFLGLIRFLKDNGLTQNISIVVPKVVFEELKKQQEKSYLTQLIKLKGSFSKYADLPGFNLEIPDLNYSKHLEQKSGGFVSKYGITQLDYPDNGVLPKLISRVLNREKPFYKKESNKDSGFKDALIWESILDYAERHKEEEIIFLTKDTDFKDAKLSQEFKERTGRDLKVIDNLTDIKTFLDETQQLNLDFAWIRNSFSQTIRETLYRVLRENFDGIAVNGCLFRVRDFRVGKDLIDINRTDKGRYELRVMIRVRHETTYTGYGVVDDIYEPYEEYESAGVALLNVEKTEKGELILAGMKFEGIELIGNKEIGTIKII